MQRIAFIALLLITLSLHLCADESSSSSLSCSSESSDHFYCKPCPGRNSENIYGPNLKVVVSPFRLGDCSIFSVCGEGGSNNIRFSGTIGYFISPKIHLKATVEQLNQKIGYHFTSGRSEQWMRQIAAGAVLQYAFCHPRLESVEIYGSYASCRSRNLCSRFCCVEQTNLLNEISRHVAGGTDIFGGIGFTLTPWHNATLCVAADYDNVSYRRKFSSNIRNQGFGGTAKLHQEFCRGISLDLKGEMRRPFNYYEGALNWTNVHPCGILTFGFYTGYTDGRGQLPNNWTSGILISADFGGMPFFSKYNNCPPVQSARGCSISPSFPLDSELIAWIAEPAVRMPTVLALSEEVILPTLEKCPPPPQPKPKPPEPSCKEPKSVTIPDQTSTPIDTSAFFDREGHPMVFTARGLPNNFHIDHLSGIIYGDINTIREVIVKVTGTTECGSTSEIFRIINEDNPYDFDSEFP